MNLSINEGNIEELNKYDDECPLCKIKDFNIKKLIINN
jgi:hypothetical protein